MPYPFAELGEFECDLEGRFSVIRTQECNLGNFICDIMVAATNADLAILNSGTLRSDCIHPAGKIPTVIDLREQVTLGINKAPFT